MPRVSVIMPVRNGERFVLEAVRSALAEIASEDELIVVDDGSTDATRNLLEALADPRIRILEGGGRGVSHARNLGIAAARGALIGFLDADDLWPAGRQSALLRALESTGRDAAFGRLAVRLEPDARPGDPAAGMAGKHICELVGSGLYRAEAVRGVGGFAEDMHLQEDADFHMRLVENGLEPALVEAETLVYRRHGGNVTFDGTPIRLALLDLARRKLARRRAGNDRKST